MEKTVLAHDDKLLVQLYQEYLDLLLRKERTKAEKLILSNVHDRETVKNIYLGVFQPAQWEVGNLWQQNKISIAMEHYCTAVTQYIMSKLYQYIFTTEKNGQVLIATSVSGELHQLGIRMVSDFFELEGWSTFFLGADASNDSIIEMIRKTNANLLAISSSLEANVHNVAKLIQDVRKVFSNNQLKIIVGGSPFNKNFDLCEEVNADGFACNAKDAITLANNLLGIV